MWAPVGRDDRRLQRPHRRPGAELTGSPEPHHLRRLRRRAGAGGAVPVPLPQRGRRRRRRPRAAPAGSTRGRAFPTRFETSPIRSSATAACSIPTSSPSPAASLTPPSASLVAELDLRVAAVDGHGFAATPFARSGELSAALGFSGHGGVWVKDETGNVAGSHKGRHLFGGAPPYRGRRAARLGATRTARPELAIASCGNAALAAAVLAARRPAGGCSCSSPPTPTPRCSARLASLRRGDRRSARARAGVRGDPTYHRLREAVAGGALPFTCQGNHNGLVVEGGETLGYELGRRPGSGRLGWTRMVVQVGGGALASACSRRSAMRSRSASLQHGPRIAHRADRERLAATGAAGVDGSPRGESGRDGARRPLGRAATASAYMWPWEGAPRSMAHGHPRRRDLRLAGRRRGDAPHRRSPGRRGRGRRSPRPTARRGEDRDRRRRDRLLGAGRTDRATNESTGRCRRARRSAVHGADP